LTNLNLSAFDHKLALDSQVSTQDSLLGSKSSAAKDLKYCREKKKVHEGIKRSIKKIY
jgi:hypothetical protein